MRIFKVTTNLTQFLKLIPRISDWYFSLMSPWSSSQCVGLLDEKPGFESQTRHQNEIQKVCLRRFSLSKFLVHTLRVNKKLP